MSKLYVAVDIGCIECGEGTHILGVFTKKKLAEQVMEDHSSRQEKDWQGKHSFEIFQIDKVDKVYKVDY